MYTTYTIGLSTSQFKSMEYVAFDVFDWIENAVHNRARVAAKEIISLNMNYCNDNGIPIAVGEENQIAQAYELGIIETAEQRHIRSLVESEVLYQSQDNSINT